MIGSHDTQRPTAVRAIGYVRVSTEEQAGQGHSLAMQPDLIRQWCALYGMELADIITDAGIGAGAALHKRPGGKELLARLRGGEADVVVVYRLDRLFRNAQHGLNFIRDELDAHGVALQSINEKVDTTSAVGKFVLTILLGAAEYERDLVRERTRAVVVRLRAQGKVYNQLPFGCVARGGELDPATGRVRGQSLFRDPATWPLREMIVAMRAADPAPSLQAIADELERRGIPAPKGGTRWGKESVKRIVVSHGDLKHIPPLPATHDPAVSEAAQP